MIRRLRLPLLFLALASLGGCAAVRPAHVTVYGEHSETETTGGPRALRTAGNKVGVSATYDIAR